MLTRNNDDSILEFHFNYLRNVDQEKADKRIENIVRMLKSETFYSDLKSGIENIDSPKHILNGKDGVKESEFKEWIESFMVYGSDVKIAFSNEDSNTAMRDFMSKGHNGWRFCHENKPEQVTGIVTSTFQTPWGYIDLCISENMVPKGFGNVAVWDIGAINTGAEFMGSAVAENLSAIVP